MKTLKHLLDLARQAAPTVAVCLVFLLAYGTALYNVHVADAPLSVTKRA